MGETDDERRTKDDGWDKTNSNEGNEMNGDERNVMKGTK
jgi:hypothetical protein